MKALLLVHSDSNRFCEKNTNQSDAIHEFQINEIYL